MRAEGRGNGGELGRRSGVLSSEGEECRSRGITTSLEGRPRRHQEALGLGFRRNARRGTGQRWGTGSPKRNAEFAYEK
jgi:hypothetical protein